MISLFVIYYGTVAHLDGRTEHPTLYLIRMCFEGTFPSVTHSGLFAPFEDDLEESTHLGASRWQITPYMNRAAIQVYWPVDSIQCPQIGISCCVRTSIVFPRPLAQKGPKVCWHPKRRAFMLEFEKMLVVNGWLNNLNLRATERPTVFPTEGDSNNVDN